MSDIKPLIEYMLAESKKELAKKRKLDKTKKVKKPFEQESSEIDKFLKEQIGGKNE